MATTKLYKIHFEEALLMQTELYYSQEAIRFLEKNSINDYLRKVRC